MPVPSLVIPQDNIDDITSGSIFNEMTKVVNTVNSHMTGLTTNGATRQDDTMIDATGLPETTTPTQTPTTQHDYNDGTYHALSTFLGAFSGTGFIAKAAAAAAQKTYAAALALLANHSHADNTTGGQLTQANTHQSPDTDVGATSLHHTLGTGANQAAAGNHTHATLYAPLTGGGTSGTWPISVTGNAATATNVAASGITGTVLAAQIDAAIARTANVPTNAGVGATGTWGISVTGSATSAATATDLSTGSILSVAKGGTGASTLPATGVVIGNGTSAVTSVAPGVSGTVLTSNGTAWTAGVVTVPDYSLTTKKLSDGAVTPYVPGTLHVYVNAMKKFDGAGNPVQWSGGDLDLSSYVPGSGTSVWVMVYLNATAAVYAAAGQASATPFKPQAIGGQTPLTYVLMYAGMTAITAADLYEWRTDFAAFAVGGGTGSGYSAVGHLHGQGGESFIAVASTDEGRVTTPNVPGMTVYVQPMRYSDTSAVVQQFPGGPSATIARPVSNPYLVAVGLSQAGSVTLSYGPENASPVRGPFLNATDIPLAYVLVRPASTRTILNDDNTNALIIDARRPYTFSSPAASGVSGVSTGGTGQSSFATAGILVSPGGTAPLVTVPGGASATVGMGVTPSVTPAGLDADGFQIGPVTVATTGTNITNFRSMHLLPPTKTGAGTVVNMYGVYTEGPTTAGTTTTIADYIKTGTTGSIGVVVDTVAAPTGNIQEWRANGTAVASVSAIGTFAPTGMRGVTAFPGTPATGLEVYREDFGSWFRWDGTAWRQVGDAYFTTAARPAAPPTDYRYLDLTDHFTYRWTGSAYLKQSTTIRQLDSFYTTDQYTGAPWTAATWGSLGTTLTFTVEDANSQIEINILLAAMIQCSVASEIATSIIIDSTARYNVSGGVVPSAGAYTKFTGGMMNVGTLSAGTHTILVQAMSVSAGTMTFIPASSSYSFLRTQVFERKP